MFFKIAITYDVRGGSAQVAFVNVNINNRINDNDDGRQTPTDIVDWICGMLPNIDSISYSKDSELDEGIECDFLLNEDTFFKTMELLQEKTKCKWVDK